MDERGCLPTGVYAVFQTFPNNFKQPKEPDPCRTMDASEILQDVFKSNDAKRLFIRLHTDCLKQSDNYFVSTSRIVNEFFPCWEEDSRDLFLAIEVRPERTYLVIDINNEYEFATAYETKNALPVYVLRQKRGRWAKFRWPPGDESLSERVDSLHDLNGFDAKTPFFANYHTRVVVYANPRRLSTI